MLYRKIISVIIHVFDILRFL